MEVQFGVAGVCAGFVWRGHSCLRTASSKMACRVSTNLACDLGRMHCELYIGSQHSIHLDVEELSPLQDMSALPTFVPHTDFSQDFRRRGVVTKMARKNPMQPKRLAPIFHHASR